MSFTINLVVANQCDICRLADDTTPMIVINQSAKMEWGERQANNIAVHRPCWEKKLAAAERKVARQQLAEAQSK